MMTAALPLPNCTRGHNGLNMNQGVHMPIGNEEWEGRTKGSPRIGANPDGM
jgi:hypothetical protein